MKYCKNEPGISAAYGGPYKNLEGLIPAPPPPAKIGLNKILNFKFRPKHLPT